jgi:hypothetical protein
MRFDAVRNFIEKLEKILLDLYDVLLECKIKVEFSTTLQRANVLLENEVSSAKQAIRKSPYWGNVYGRDADDLDNAKLLKMISEKSVEDQQIVLYTTMFTTALSDDSVSADLIRKLVFPLTEKDWADFSQAKRFYRAIENPGLGTTVNYNTYGDAAYIKILSHVPETFIVDTPQIIPCAALVTFIKDVDGLWKIYAMGGEVDPYAEFR